PLALLVLVFDHFGIARDALLFRCGPGGRQRLRMRREGLRKHAFDLVGPAAVVLDDFIRHMRHWSTFAVRAASLGGILAQSAGRCTTAAADIRRLPCVQYRWERKESSCCG